jgi:phosphomannomutase
MSAPVEIKFGTDGWRAVIGADFTYDSLRRVADATGRVFAKDHPGGCILVGYDTRFEAGAFAEAAAEVLASHGLDVILSDSYMPTPALCWSVARDERAVGGVMLTASHNPARYLGFKIRMADGGASPVTLTDEVEAALLDEPPAGRGSYETADFMTPYVETLTAMVDADAIRAANLRVVVDSLFGAGQAYLADIMRDLGVDVHEIHEQRNPCFGGLHPEPIPPHTDSLRDSVTAAERDAGFVTDGDADRIGAIDEHGNFVNPHRIICLVARHLAEDKGLTGRIVKTVSTSVLVDRLGTALGMPVTTTPVGFKWIYEEMLAGDVLIGGEESGGIGFPPHVRERDGLLMALFLVEMMAQRGQSLGQLVESLFELTGPMEYLRYDMSIDPETKESFLARVPDYAPAEVAGLAVLDIQRSDGLKFLLPDDAWLLLRPSGTEPLVRVYAEASSAGVVDDLLAAGKAIVLGEA